MNAQSDPRETTDVDLDNDVDTEVDPYDSFAEGEPYAHHVISPALLAGFSDAPIAVCRVFHRALFELLDGVGSFDGLIVTPAALIGPSDSTKWQRAYSWLRTSPAPDAQAMYDEHLAAGYEPDEASDHVTHTVTHHSLSLAVELGTNPSFTHTSLGAVAHAVLTMIATEIDRNDVRYIDVLTEVALAVLVVTSFDCRLDGGARVIDTEALLDLAQEAAASA